MVRLISSICGVAALALATLALPAGSQAQDAPRMERVPDRTAGEGIGPFGRMLIRGATLIDGSGAPPEGPVDILVAGNRIEAIYRGDARARSPRSVDHVIEADGMYVMPGFVDVHGHNGDPRKAPNASYGYRLWLAHGVTTVRGVPIYSGPNNMAISDRARSRANSIVAPRIFAYAVFGDEWSGGAVDSPAQARAWVRWAAGRGYDGVKFFNQVPPAVLEAALDEAEAQGLGTVAHLGQRGVAEVNARRAVELGLAGITHFYGHFESLLREGAVVRYPSDYNYLDEQSRFSEIARLAEQSVEPGSEAWNAYLDTLLEHEVTMSPTFNIYSASRDVMRARTAEWHDRYTLPSLWDFYQPSLTNHGSYYHDWSTGDEVAWRNFYRLWMRLTRDYLDRGGHISAGSDPGYIYQTWGFAYIGELEMLQEAGLTPLEVIQAATINGAREIYAPRGEEPPFGIVRPGMLADLVIVPANPLENLKILYGTGHLRLNRETNRLERIGGVRWTIKDGIVYDAPALLESVAAMVEAQRAERAATP
ncbi:MAG: amidohydrolase family protein [Parasphingopyxis sp.]